MIHNFSIDLAQEFGVNEAIFVNNIYYWEQNNEVNRRNYVNDRYWTHNSLEAFCLTYPYWTKKQIRTIIQHCVDKGLIVVDEFNEEKRDRTKWYSTTEAVKKYYQKGQMHVTKWANACDQMGTPLPYNYTTYNKENTNINVSTKEKPKKAVFTKPTVEEIQAYCKDRNNKIEAQYFYDFYESKDWLIGKVKMKDWQAAIRTWERNDKNGTYSKPTKQNTQTVENNSFNVDEFYERALARSKEDMERIAKAKNDRLKTDKQ